MKQGPATAARRMRLLRVLGAEVPGLVAYLDRDLRYRYLNDRYRAWFGIEPDKLHGEKVMDFGSDLGRGSFEDELRRAVAGESVEIIRRMQFRDGGDWWLKTFAWPDRGPDGQVRGVVLVTFDCSFQKAVAEAADEAKRDNGDASAARTWFLATASHDLRQPLYALRLLASQIERQPLDANVRAHVAQMMTTIDQMERMFESHIAVAKLDAMGQPAMIQPVVIGDVLGRVVRSFAGAATAKGIALRSVPSTLRAPTDHRVLETILRNLVWNAVKHTQSGRVLIGVRRRPDRLSIEVHDTGPGIPDEDRGRLFNLFDRLDLSGRESGAGAGLGLLIASRLATLIAAELRVESVAGKGSCFTIDIPRSPFDFERFRERMVERRSIAGGEDGGPLG